MNDYEELLRQLFNQENPLAGGGAPQAQEPPQLQQGLLGSTNSADEALRDLSTRGSDEAAQIARTGQAMMANAGGNDTLAQRQAATAQIGQQAMAQQQQQEQQSMQMLMTLAKLFMGA